MRLYSKRLNPQFPFAYSFADEAFRNLYKSEKMVGRLSIALLIASPLAWWAMTRWLQGFAYHIYISWWMFLAAGALAILIALATVSFHAIRAALSDPAKNLRSE